MSSQILLDWLELDKGRGSHKKYFFVAMSDQAKVESKSESDLRGHIGYYKAQAVRSPRTCLSCA